MLIDYFSYSAWFFSPAFAVKHILCESKRNAMTTIHK